MVGPSRAVFWASSVTQRGSPAWRENGKVGEGLRVTPGSLAPRAQARAVRAAPQQDWHLHRLLCLPTLLLLGALPVMSWVTRLPS